MFKGLLFLLRNCLARPTQPKLSFLNIDWLFNVPIYTGDKRYGPSEADVWGKNSPISGVFNCHYAYFMKGNQIAIHKNMEVKDYSKLPLGAVNC